MQFFSEGQLKNFLQRAELEGFELYQEQLDAEATYLQYSRTISTRIKPQADKFSKPLE